MNLMHKRMKTIHLLLVLLPLPSARLVAIENEKSRCLTLDNVGLLFLDKLRLPFCVDNGQWQHKAVSCFMTEPTHRRKKKIDFHTQQRQRQRRQHRQHLITYLSFFGRKINERTSNANNILMKFKLFPACTGHTAYTECPCVYNCCICNERWVGGEEGVGGSAECRVSTFVIIFPTSQHRRPCVCALEKFLWNTFLIGEDVFVRAANAEKRNRKKKTLFILSAGEHIHRRRRRQKKKKKQAEAV